MSQTPPQPPYGGPPPLGRATALRRPPPYGGQPPYGAPPPYGPPPPRRQRPRAMWFVIGGVLLVLAPVIFLGALFTVLRPLTQEDAVFPADGQEHQVSVDAGEERALFSEDGPAVQCVATDRQRDRRPVPGSPATSPSTSGRPSPASTPGTATSPSPATACRDPSESGSPSSRRPATFIAGILVGVIVPLILGLIGHRDPGDHRHPLGDRGSPGEEDLGRAARPGGRGRRGSSACCRSRTRTSCATGSSSGRSTPTRTRRTHRSSAATRCPRRWPRGRPAPILASAPRTPERRRPQPGRRRRPSRARPAARRVPGRARAAVSVRRRGSAPGPGAGRLRSRSASSRSSARRPRRAVQQSLGRQVAAQLGRRGRGRRCRSRGPWCSRSPGRRRSARGTSGRGRSTVAIGTRSFSVATPV